MFRITAIQREINRPGTLTLTLKMICSKITRFRHAARFAALCLVLVAATSRADILYVSEADGTIDKYDTATGINEGVFANNSSGLNGPEGIALDSFGNLYAASYGNDEIMKFTPGGTGSVFANVGSSLNGPINLAVNPLGDVYVTRFSSNNITEFSPSGSLLSSINSSSLSDPQGLAFDKSGNLYIASWGNGNIVKYSAAGFTTFAQENFGQGPYDMAFDTAGNMYVANFNGTNIEKFTTGGIRSLYDTAGLNSPIALEFDSAGDLFIANYYGNSITEITSGGVETTFASLGSHPYDLAIEPVPEPGVFVLSLTGVLGMVGLRLRHRRS